MILVKFRSKFCWTDLVMSAGRDSSASEMAILVEKVAEQPVSLNLGQPHLASTPPVWVNLNWPLVTCEIVRVT